MMRKGKGELTYKQLYDAINRLKRENGRLRNELNVAQDALRAQKERNAPLTLDELREMDREPVYIWYPYPKYGEWVISDGFNQYKNFTSTDNDSWYSGDYGKTWLAYRHKQEDGTI